MLERCTLQGSKPKRGSNSKPMAPTCAESSEKGPTPCVERAQAQEGEATKPTSGKGSLQPMAPTSVQRQPMAPTSSEESWDQILGMASARREAMAPTSAEDQTQEGEATKPTYLAHKKQPTPLGPSGKGSLQPMAPMSSARREAMAPTFAEAGPSPDRPHKPHSGLRRGFFNHPKVDNP